MSHRIIFDTDSSVFNDDAAALAMLLQRRDLVEILGITVVAGNHTVAQGSEYMLHLLELMHSEDVPLFLGTDAPLVNTPERVAQQEKQWGSISFKGAFKSATKTMPPFGGQFASIRPQPIDATSFIIDSIDQYPNEVTIVAVGPMTNLATAFHRRPDLPEHIKRLVFMGGNARAPGNVTRAAEFNFWFDPEAAAAVLKSGVRNTVMFGLEITNLAPIRKTLFDAIIKVDTPLTRLMRHDLEILFQRDPSNTYYAWDCTTAAWLIDPSIVTMSEHLSVIVDTTFGPNYGGTMIDTNAGDGASLEVMLSLDVEKFYEMYEDLLTRPV